MTTVTKNPLVNDCKVSVHDTIETILRDPDIRFELKIEVTLGNTYWVQIDGDGLHSEYDCALLDEALTCAWNGMIDEKKLFLFPKRQPKL